MQDSHQEIALKRCKKKQNSEKFNSKTLKLQPVNLSETSGDTVSVHQRVADSPQSF